MSEFKADATEQVVSTTNDVQVDGDSNTTSTPEGEQANKPSFEELQKQLNDMKAEKAKDAELLKKLRKFEKENKERAEQEMVEKGKYKELYEKVISERQTEKLNGAIEKALKESGVKALDTALALIDKSQIQVEDGEINEKSLAALVRETKKKHAILFEQESEAKAETKAAPVAPSVKRATEGSPVGGYEAEMRNARTQKEINAVLAKYQK